MAKLMHKAILVTLLIASAPAAVFSSGPQPAQQTSDQMVDYTLQITQVSAGTVLAEWDAMPGAGAYRVIVRDLTTSQILSSFDTWNTSAVISSLPPGHSLRFSVTKLENLVLSDIIIL